MAGALQVSLDVPLPRELHVGDGTALFVCGTCFHPAARIETLSFVLDGAEQPVSAHGMPRLDYFASLHPALDPYETGGLLSDPSSRLDPNLYSYRSGFWGTVRVGPRATHAPLELSLRARLHGGELAEAPLPPVPLSSLPEPLEAPRGRLQGDSVVVCMATYDPPPKLLRRQIESIRAQTHERWVCVISDDCSRSERYAELQGLVDGDDRFLLSRSERRQGFYLNFQRALALAPRGARFIALADQDDRWYPEKLRELLAARGDAKLVYSDARVVDDQGDVVAETYWSRRANNHEDLLSLLVANSVTGAASLFPADLLRDILPFPPAQFAHYHDHWIGLVALALGDIRFVCRPLYDYVQHGDAALGHAAANKMPSLRDRLAGLRGDLHQRVGMWRLHYFVDVGRLTQVATILQLRCGSRMSASKRRALNRFLAAEHSPRALIGLMQRGAAELLRSRPQTLGAEWMLSYAFAWRRLLGISARNRPQRALRLDAVPPPDLVMHPGRRAPEVALAARQIAEKIAPLRLQVAESVPPRVNILIPTFDLAHFFGGYIAKFNLARRLADRGRRVRLVTVDPVGALPPDWQATVESYSGLAGLFDRVEIAFGRESSALEVSPSDRFVATTWWTAHIAAHAVDAVGGNRFLYLIQEYEPFTFPMGTLAALAEQSYGLPHQALFSTELLREYFRRHGLGVYGRSRGGDEASAVFQNAITPIAPPSAAELIGRSTRSLLFYARPEPHAARNMFELGVLALAEAASTGALRGWGLHGIGTLGREPSIPLGGEASLKLLPRAEQETYADLLRGHDVGLALMYTPHPSLVPIEMASAGMLTVTNSFENKTQARLSEISTNLIAAPPTIEGVAAALTEAVAAAGDFERRMAGSQVCWSRSWQTALDDRLLDRITALLDG